MPTHRLNRSVPFWVLVGGSAVAIAGGAYLLITKLAVMASTITDNTATGIEVYVGQGWATFGAILIGVGLVGFALALAIGALGSLVPAAAPEIVEPIAWEEEVVEVSYPAAAAPVAEAAPVAAEPEAAPVADAPVTTEPTAAEPNVSFGEPTEGGAPRA